MLLSAALGLSYSSLFWAALLIANAVASGVAVGFAYWVDSRLPVSLEDVSNAAQRE